MKVRTTTYKSETNFRARQKMSATPLIPLKEDGCKQVKKVGYIPAQQIREQSQTEVGVKMDLTGEEEQRKMDSGLYKARLDGRMEKEEIKCRVVRQG